MFKTSIIYNRTYNVLQGIQKYQIKHPQQRRQSSNLHFMVVTIVTMNGMVQFLTTFQQMYRSMKDQ